METVIIGALGVAAMAGAVIFSKASEPQAADTIGPPARAIDVPFSRPAKNVVDPPAAMPQDQQPVQQQEQAPAQPVNLTLLATQQQVPPPAPYTGPDVVRQLFLGPMPEHDFSKADAFQVAVEHHADRLFGAGFDDDVAFEVCRESFASFASKFGHFLFASDKSSFDHDIMAFTTTLSDELPKGRGIGANFGTVARRYMELRRHVSGPYIAHNDKGSNANARRYRLWRDGWEKEDKYKELSLVQRVRRNPMIIGTNNWMMFLHLSVQYSVIELLYAVFRQVTKDLLLNPLSWNKLHVNVEKVVNKHIEALEGSTKVGKKRSKETLTLAAVIILGKMLTKFSNLKPAAFLSLTPAVIKHIAEIKKAGGKVKIDKETAAQLTYKMDEAGKLSNNVDATAAVRSIFDEFACFAAVLYKTSKSYSNEPAYLTGGSSRTTLSNGRH